ncbi:PQQ-binding-like beta-propeller repeat protein [Sandaracinus amylolyticus]|uniref:outer membrane protein assembly factor BamB family protein n=1 Tax=Sandaracinus amylolyticus TaxID=927083 RepID=UPI001F255F8A|nr:PQQ-binding-like beta-propeller repeat protein [Sandaracinus amylolyticus]UJR82333.1 Hypothetical protein I5071_43980 [Sandaracinus amylolyticus]
MRRALVMLACVLAACGGGAFEPQYPERQEPHMSGVMRELAETPARAADPVIVAVTTSPPGLLCWDLREGRERWRVQTDARSTPIVAGEHVVTTEAEGVVVRRLGDGSRVLALDEQDLHLVGADGEAGTLVIALARGEGDTPLGHVVGVRDGGVAWSHELPLSVGSPAVAGALVLVPWGHQRLSILDAATGLERLRLRMEHAVLGHAMHDGARVMVGQHRVFPVSAELFEDERAQRRAGLEPRGRALPGQPPLLPDAYEPRMNAESARNRVRLAWALADGEPASFADDALYFVFYRLVFGLAAGEDEVRWVHDREHDVVGADAVPGGLVVLTDDGRISLLGARDGRPRLEASLGVPVRAADVRADGLAVPDASTSDPAPPLRDRLHAVASLHDVRVGAGRAFAIRFLARDPSADVTAQLVALCADRSDTSQARAAACEQLAVREQGGEHVLAALREGASYLEQRPAPPIAALARAAGTMRLRQALPYLVTHLEDPATPVDELPGLFEGLAALGDARALAPIERFVRLYHADATDARMIDALAAGARAVVALAPVRLDAVRGLADDPLAPAPVRERLAQALAPPAPSEPAPTPPPARERPQPAAAPEPEPAADLPEAVTTEMTDAVMAPVQARLRACLERAEGDPLPSARIAVMIDEAGAIQTVSVTPADLQSCVEPLVRPRTFPRTRRGRQVVVHTVRR